SVPKKKGRLVGLGRRPRSVPPSSAPPPFVDPEVLTAQLKDKDDRISLNISSELPRIGPLESPSKNPEEVLPRYIPKTFPTNWWSLEFPRNSVGNSFLRNSVGNSFPRNSVGNFRGKSEEK
uniref:Uncharacterized protein n=1 Tax=Brassica oleracea var. oleracea TaxID=109376 RepID=A0A0D3D7L1_BRAOL